MKTDAIATHDRQGYPRYASDVLSADEYGRWRLGLSEPVSAPRDPVESAALVAALVELQGAGQ